MALFQNRVDDAIKSAIAMQKKIREINVEIKKFNVEKIKIGIGIHTGTLMLGIIGEENRLEGTVIADAVNLASRMEGLTKHYGASILISEDVYNGIEQKEKYNIIYIDEVKVYGKEKQISIYEVIDGIDDEEFEEKLSNRDEFEKGLYLYQNCKIEKAQIIFDKLLKKSKYSKVIMLYKERCERDREKCIGEENYYVEKLDEK